jgi:hypothetical protein
VHKACSLVNHAGQAEFHASPPQKAKRCDQLNSGVRKFEKSTNLPNLFQLFENGAAILTRDSLTQLRLNIVSQHHVKSRIFQLINVSR